MANTSDQRLIERKGRLDRVLANLGYGSRSEIKTDIARGRVAVGDQIIHDPSAHVFASTVTFDGAALERPNGILVALHKPAGFVCSHDPDEGPRIYDLLPTRWSARNPQVISAGRLDKETTGIIVVTDDHQRAHQLTSPKRHVAKIYEATLDVPVTDDMIEQFALGTIVLNDGSAPCRPATLTRDDITGTRVTVVLHEGRYHQVRRMFAALGAHVITLHRRTFGDWDLNDLAIAEGEWCDL